MIDLQKIDFNLFNAQIKARAENLGYFKMYKSTYILTQIYNSPTEIIKLILKARYITSTIIFEKLKSRQKLDKV